MSRIGHGERRDDRDGTVGIRRSIRIGAEIKPEVVTVGRVQVDVQDAVEVPGIAGKGAAVDHVGDLDGRDDDVVGLTREVPAGCLAEAHVRICASRRGRHDQNCSE